MGHSEEHGPAAPAWVATGNHYLAFPCIGPADGGVHRVNVLHRGLLGLLEWAADREAVAEREPFLAPRVAVDGRSVSLARLQWERVDRWMPGFRGEAEGIAIEGTICAPGGPDAGFRGAVYRIRVENRQDREREVRVGFDGVLRWALQVVGTARPLPAPNRLVAGRDARGVALESGGPGAGAALALVMGGDDVRAQAGAAPDSLAELRAGAELAAPNGEPLYFRIERPVTLAAGGRATVALYLGVGPERDGALESAAFLRRIGADELVRACRLELARLAHRLDDSGLAAVLNRNMLFNYYFAVGRAVDDDRLYPVASRSALNHRGAVFSERETLWWSLPALALADPPLARETLLRCFEQFSHRPGERTRYVDGGVLAQGVALDRLCAYGVALDRYVQDSGDRTLLEDPLIQDVLREIDAALLARLHPEIFLCSSDTAPGTGPAAYPYVTVGNVFLWAFCNALDRVWIPRDDDDRAHFAGAADEVAAAVWRHCTAEVGGLRILAWSTSLEGDVAVYDDPALSLQLLPFLGFCDADDPIWRNTEELLHSSEYRFWIGDRPFPGRASRQRPDEPALAALCADLLSERREEALPLLRRLELDGGLACETFDVDTGAVRSGRQYAALAGFLAWSLWVAVQS